MKSIFLAIGVATLTTGSPEFMVKMDGWNYQCTEIEHFEKIAGGSDRVRINNFLIKEGPSVQEPSLTEIKVSFSVTNLSDKVINLGAQFLAFRKDDMPSFVLSVPGWNRIAARSGETVSSYIFVPPGTLEGAHTICVNVAGDL